MKTCKYPRDKKIMPDSKPDVNLPGANHSRAPWTTDGKDEVLDQHGRMVADIFGSDDEQAANAVLVAAAPELHFWLVHTLGMLDKMKELGVIRETGIMESARKILAESKWKVKR